jgi:nucleotidyltransferase substrate binding protein (TIGR01987 family)
MKLELQSLASSVDALARILEAEQRLRNDANAAEDVKEGLRGGAIQSFEVAYEQSWKMMKRWVETQGDAASVDGVPRRELYRIAAEHRLIGDVDQWMEFHRARNETSHTYDGAAAARVLEAARNFLAQAQSLRKELEARNAGA